MKEDVDRRALNLGAGEPPAVIAAGKAHLERLARTSVLPSSEGPKDLISTVPSLFMRRFSLSGV